MESTAFGCPRGGVIWPCWPSAAQPTKGTARLLACAHAHCTRTQRAAKLVSPVRILTPETVVQPNGSRLSCGANAGGRKRPALRYRLAGAQTSASFECRPTVQAPTTPAARAAETGRGLSIRPRPIRYNPNAEPIKVRASMSQMIRGKRMSPSPPPPRPYHSVGGDGGPERGRGRRVEKAIRSRRMSTLPNGSRLSCGVSAGRRKRPVLWYPSAGAQTDASFESRPRQLQALVRRHPFEAQTRVSVSPRPVAARRSRARRQTLFRLAGPHLTRQGRGRGKCRVG